MTVSVEQTRFPYDGDGNTRDWDFDCSFKDEANIKVWLKLSTDATESLLNPSVYEITANVGNIGGSVLYPILPEDDALVDGDRIAIKRVSPKENDYNFADQVKLLASSVEASDDDKARQIAENYNTIQEQCVILENTSDQTPLEAVFAVLEAADAAETSAEEAAASAVSAATSETNAGISEDNAAASAAGVDLPSAVAETWLYQPVGAAGYVLKTSAEAATLLFAEKDTDDLDEGTSNLYNQVPAGGTANQILSKINGTDYNIEWKDSGYQTGYINGGVIQYVDDDSVSITAGICRDADDGADITIQANADITNTLLADETYFVNVDSSGVSTISTSIGTGTNRKVGSFITDSSGDIIPFTNIEKSGGGVETIYTVPIVEADVVSVSYVSKAFSVPSNISRVIANWFTNTSGAAMEATGSYSIDGTNDYVKSTTMEDAGKFSSDTISGNLPVINGVGYFKTSNANAEIKINTNGYVDERLV